jgi:CNT family concentrative nucleoside transporter
MDHLVPLIGFVFFIFLAWVFSEDRKRFPWRVVLWGSGLQFAIAISILGIPALGVPGIFAFLFSFINDAVDKLLSFSDQGASFLFGSLMDPTKHGYVFAFRALPTILFFSSLVAILYHVGVLQKVVAGMSRVMEKTLRTSGAESLAAAANIFVGQTEAPLLVKPFISTMTRSEIFAVMVPGMASVAGGVLAAYVGLLNDQLPSIAGHLVTASVMSAPAGLLIAKVMVPEKEKPLTMNGVEIPVDRPDTNVIEAAARGASEGLSLALNVGAMVIVFIALIALANWGLGWVSTSLGAGEALTFQKILGFLFSPLAWLMGVPWADARLVGEWLGEKVVLNEFVAYVHMAEAKAALNERTLVIASYALCGFANFSSIGIQLGGIGAMAPNKRGELAQLGLLCMIGGNLSTFMTAAIVGLIS